MGAFVFDCGQRLGIQKLGNFLLSSPLMFDTELELAVEEVDAVDLLDTTLASDPILFGVARMDDVDGV